MPEPFETGRKPCGLGFDGACEWAKAPKGSFTDRLRARMMQGYSCLDHRTLADWGLFKYPATERNLRFPPRETVSELQRRIRMKVSELVDEEETLVNLYVTAAQVARERENEVKHQMVDMIHRLRKDRVLLQNLRDLN